MLLHLSIYQPKRGGSFAFIYLSIYLPTPGWEQALLPSIYLSIYSSNNPRVGTSFASARRTSGTLSTTPPGRAREVLEVLQVHYSSRPSICLSVQCTLYNLLCTMYNAGQSIPHTLKHSRI